MELNSINIQKNNLKDFEKALNSIDTKKIISWSVECDNFINTKGETIFFYRAYTEI